MVCSLVVHCIRLKFTRRLDRRQEYRQARTRADSLDAGCQRGAHAGIAGNRPTFRDRMTGQQGGQFDFVLAAGYGIFSGRVTQWAKLRFTPSAARWVAAEKWHTRQKSRFEEDGSYLLEVPYAEEQELVMDLLRYGADVEVLEPAPLRERVTAALTAALARYR